jgi:hypothetical protein
LGRRARVRCRRNSRHARRGERWRKQWLGFEW